MRPRDLALALAAFASLVAFTPLWVTFLTDTGMGAQAAWVASLTLPAMMAMFVTSWVKPEMTTPVLGVFVLAGVLAVAPELWDLAALGAGEAPAGGLSEGLFQLAVPIIVVAFVLSLGWRHMRQIQ
jgi:hypothetical protein